LRLDCCLENLVTIGLDANKEYKDCNNEHKQAKLGHEQKHNESHIRVAKSFPATISSSFSPYSFQAVASLPEVYPVNNAPPQRANIPLFILHCVHRI
jgi:hypothetical protein